MSNRDFSDTVKLDVIKSNLEKNSGRICCEVCGNCLVSIKECHFDHIYPYVKGGKSTFDNCQILCTSCNLKKNDKEIQDFILEEKAKSFLSGEDTSNVKSNEEDVVNKDTSKVMTKEMFDLIVAEFIQRKGNINKVDFGREYNKLPSFRYVKLYYGDLNNLKKEFGIEDMSYNWNRETIKSALQTYVFGNGVIFQKDLIKANKLPSLPCILSYYPEYKNFTDVKKELCNLDTAIHWTKELAIENGKLFVKENGKITQKDLKAENKLPSHRVVERLFGSLSEYQSVVGAEVYVKNEYISKEEITKAVDDYFQNRERVIESKKVFFEGFVYSSSTISKRYGTFSSFCKEQGIKVLVSKIARYSKREVDDIISKWIKEGNEIPKSTELAKLGLPSRDVILKYYENWKEPFYIYIKLYEELNRQ